MEQAKLIGFEEPESHSHKLTFENCFKATPFKGAKLIQYACML
jgi:hypothetical protein